MFLMITTAIAVFVGVGFFAAVAGLLFAALLKEIIDSIVRNWNAKSAN